MPAWYIRKEWSSAITINDFSSCLHVAKLSLVVLMHSTLFVTLLYLFLILIKTECYLDVCSGNLSASLCLIFSSWYFSMSSIKFSVIHLVETVVKFLLNFGKLFRFRPCSDTVRARSWKFTVNVSYFQVLWNVLFHTFFVC